VQLARAQYRQHHELIEIGAPARDADLLAHQRMAAVAANGVVRLQHLLRAAAVLGDGDADAVGILRDPLRRPAEGSLDARQLRQARAQAFLGEILRQPLHFLEIIGIDDLAQRRRVPVFAHQVLVCGDPADGEFGRQQPYRAHLVGDTPEVEVLHGALRQTLALGNALRGQAALDERTGDSALSELDRERDADRSSADNDDLVS
jgi:hypothetical protein